MDLEPGASQPGIPAGGPADPAGGLRREGTWSAGARRGTVLLCFFLSGATGLIYENVWVKELALVFGSTVTASTLVLGTFMGGLALGSWLLGPWGSRQDRPLEVYGWLELVMALACALFPAGLVQIRHAYFEGLVTAGLPRWMDVPFQFLAGGALLLVPTALMGATLPVLCEHVNRMAGRPGRVMGLLYGVNTAGAVLGSLGAGFGLIPWLGLTTSLYVAVVINGLVGVLALLAGGTGPPPGPARDRIPAKVPGPPGPSVPVSSLLVFVFVNGFFAMAYQIALMKFLPLVFGSSVHSFSLMVSAFIAGISLGSLLAGRILARGGHAGTWMALSQILAGFLFLVSVRGCDLLPLVYVALRRSLNVDFWMFQTVLFVLVFVLLSIPAIFLGMALPLACEAGGNRSSGLGSWVSRLYASSTLGNILGTGVAGFWMIAGFGFQTTLLVASAFNVILGTAMLRFSSNPGRLVPAGGPVLVVLAVALVRMPRIDPAFLSSEFFRKGRIPSGDLVGMRERLGATRDVLFWHEDASAVVSVERDRGSGGLSLKVNGKADASTGRDIFTQALMAHLPLLAHPDPRTCLVIGLGSGMTHAAGLTHGLERLESVEISPGVVVASIFFRELNGNLLENPRFRLHIDDGRNFLFRNPSRMWDVIVSEPSNPWFAGISNLYTVEFFNEARRRLGPGGVMCQWIQGYEMSNDTFELILRTFGAAFPHVEVFRSVGFDYILLGSEAPLDLEPLRIARRMTRPDVARNLAAIGIDSPLELAAHHLVSSRDFHHLAGAGPVNTDDEGVLEYLAPLELYRAQRVDVDQDQFRSTSRNYLFRRFVERLGVSPAELLDVVRHMDAEWSQAMIVTTLGEVVERAPDLVPARLTLAGYLSRHGRYVEALDHIRRAADLRPDDEEVLVALADVLFKIEMQTASVLRPADHAQSLAVATRLHELHPDRPRYYAWMGLSLLRMERHPAVLDLAAAFDRRAAGDELESLRPQVEALRAASLVSLGRWREAREILATLPALPGEVLPGIVRRAATEVFHQERRAGEPTP